MIELDPKSTALVLIDLQKGILANALAPVASQELLARGQALAERFRAAKRTTVTLRATPAPIKWGLLLMASLAFIVPFVMAMQMARFMLVLIVGPTLARAVARWTGS